MRHENRIAIFILVIFSLLFLCIAIINQLDIHILFKLSANLLVFSLGFLFIYRRVQKKVVDYKIKLESLEQRLEKEQQPTTEDTQKEWVPLENSRKIVEELALYKKRITQYQDSIDGFTGILNNIETLIKDYNPVDNDISSQLDEFKKNTNFINANVNKAFDISDNLSKSAKNAFEVSETVQNGIKQVSSALGESVKHSTILLEQSLRITNIINVLEDISSKINILSMNASIVSARAGQAGKEFEVVAKEIRKLAADTDKSLKDIEQETNSIQQIIQIVVQKNKYANTQSSKEKDLLISVVGLLQGITLGVEVFRAVSKSARDKSLEQKMIMENIVQIYNQLLTFCKKYTEQQQALLNYWSGVEKIDDLDENIEKFLKQNE